MSKRFTESDKWRDTWFWELPPDAKLFWLYLLDTCDNAGVVEVNFKIASFQIGMPISSDTLARLEGRIERLECGKFWIPKFIPFQVGTPSNQSKAHNPIFLSLRKHRLEDRVLRGYPESIDTLQEKDKDKEEIKVGKGSAEGKPNGDWPTRIRTSYVSQTHQGAAVTAIVHSLMDHAPELILQGTRECAAAVRAKESRIGGAYGFTPNPATFFENELWLDSKRFAAKLEANEKEWKKPPSRLTQDPSKTW